MNSQEACTHPAAQHFRGGIHMCRLLFPKKLNFEGGTAVEEQQMSKIFTDSTVDQRVSVLEKYLEDLSLHRDSRKGLDGARGPQGEPSTVPGPQGPAGRDGRDADITQVVEAALKRVREEFDAEYKIL